MEYIRMVAIISASILLFITTGSSFAHNKVVVIPFGDDSFSVNNVVTVAPEGADFNRVSEAVASITDASESNPYLVYIAPGEYRLRNTIRMKPYVNIVGSGRDTTILIGRLITEVMNNSTCSGSRVMVLGGSNPSRISNLSMVHTGSEGETLVGICTTENDEYSVYAENINILIQDGTNNIAAYSQGTIELKNSRIWVFGRNGGNNNYGVFAYVSDGSVNVINSTILVRSQFSPNGGNFSVVTEAFPEEEFTASVNLRGSEILAGDVLSSGAGGVVTLRQSLIFQGNVLTEGDGAFKSYHSTIVGDIGGAGEELCLFTSSESDVLNDDCT